MERPALNHAVAFTPFSQGFLRLLESHGSIFGAFHLDIAALPFHVIDATVLFQYNDDVFVL